MPIIVSANSPLNILIRVGQVDLLRQLFGQVVIPDAVAQEMSHAKAPQVVRDFVATLPDWLLVQSPKTLLPIDELDAGEVAAISLALELGASLMIDERVGREIARAKGLQVVGAVGILELGANRGLVQDLASVHDRIRSMRFHISERILSESLDRHRQFNEGST